MDYLQFVCHNALILFQSFADQFELDNYVVQQLSYIVEQTQTILDNTPTVAHVERYKGLMGRPKIHIQRDQLHHLLESQFTAPSISQMLGVSVRTVFRRMQEYGLSVSACYSTMSDHELDNLVRAIKSQMPNAGYRTVKGQLMAMGSRVQWDRIQDCMHRVDAAGVLSRLARLGCTVRRSYSVRGPLALVHVDTCHKLIRFALHLGSSTI